MRTKALLVGAIIGAASLVSSQAQVYSVNIVGYINVPIYQGWNLIANQLNNSAGNTVANLLPTPPVSISVFTYIAEQQTYDSANYDADFGEWDKPGLLLTPGKGAFILSGAPFTITFVGEVMTGPQTTPLVQGWQLVAPIVPQDGDITIPEAQGGMNYTPSAAGDSLFWYDGSKQTYVSANYDGDFQSWDRQPVTTVGAGFFALRSSGGSWTRNFSVSN